jgi:hypothetical protein
MREKMIDTLIGATIKTVEEIEALLSMVKHYTSENSSSGAISSSLRRVADLFDRLSLLENDLVVIKRRLRSSLSSDPDKTPRAVSVRDFVAVTPETETRYEAVEDQERRINTRPGIGVVSKPPLPKKTPH